MSVLVVRLLGEFCVHRDGEALCERIPVRAQELLAYLLLHHGRPLRRDGLIAALWTDTEPAQARKALRQALWHLQSALAGPQVDPDGELLTVDADRIGLNPRVDLWLDLAELHAAHRASQGVAGPDLSSADVARLRQAVESYRGDLLEGWYHEWLLYDREHVQQVLLSLLDKLMAHAEAHDQFEAGIAYGARILRFDRAHERTHRRLMRLHYRSGDRTAALRQFERCSVALEHELDVRPSKATLAVYAQVRDGETVGGEPAPHLAAVADGHHPLSLCDVIEYLKQIQPAVGEILSSANL